MKMFTFFLFLFPALTFAAEYDFHANKGDRIIELSGRYSISTATSFLGQESEIKDSLARLSFEYGLSKDSSVYANTAFGSAEQTPSNITFEGFDSLNLGYKYSKNKLFIFSNIGINSFEKIKSANRSTGNVTIRTKIGYNFIKTESNSLAAFWDQGVFGSVPKDEDGTNLGKLSYGSSFSVAYEKILSKLNLGAVLTYNLDTIANGTEAAIGNLGLFSVKSVASDSIALKAYSRYHISEKQSLYGALLYNTVVDHGNTLVDTEDTVLMTFGYRLTL